MGGVMVALVRRGIAFWATLLLAIFLAAWAMQPPPPRAEGAGRTDGFSLDRALTDLRIIARAPHITGSAQNAIVRDYLVNQLSGIGLSPQVQRGTGVHQDRRGQQVISIAQVENIVAVLPGRDRAQPAVAVMAHYDSVPFSPGASDDGAGTVALLETARALAAGPTPARDVIFLITDGEEFGLTGAQLFFDDHPLATRIGIVVNAEARGSTGRATMFQTSPGNAELVTLWADNAISPSGNSMSDAIYRLLPNDTDLTVALGRNIAGINAAYIGGHFDYHSTTDSIAVIDRGSLQHLGDFALTTTRALAMAPALPARDHDSIYFDLFGLAVVHYPPWLGWVPLALGGLGLTLLYRRERAISVRRKLGGVAGVITVTVGLGGICHAVGAWMIGSGSARLREAMAEGDSMIWALAGLVLAAFLLIRPGRAMQLGAVATLLALATIAQILLPGAAMLFAWPAVLAVGLAWPHSEARSSAIMWIVRTVIIVVGTGAMLGLIFQLVATAYVGVGLLSGGVIALALPFMVALLAPMMAPASDCTNEAERHARSEMGAPIARSRGLLSALTLSHGSGFVTLALSLATISWLALSNGFSARHPRPGDFFALYNADNGQAYWATTSDESYLPDDTAARFRYEPFTRWQIIATPAPGGAAPGPDRRISVVQTNTASGRRWAIAIPSAPRFVLLAVRPNVPMRNVRLNGRRITLVADSWSRLFYRVPQPITLQLTADGPVNAALEIRTLYATPGLPAGAPRGPGLATNWTLLTGTQVVVARWPEGGRGDAIPNRH